MKKSLFILSLSLINIFQAGFLSAQEPLKKNHTKCIKKESAPSFKALRAITGAEKSDSIDILNLTINLDITDFTNKKIKGNCAILFTPKLNAISSISLDLLKLTVDSITNENGILAHSYNDTLLIVNFGQTLNVSDTSTITVYYQGKPVQDASWGGFYFQGNYAYNLGVGFDSNPHNYGRVWFPCFDNFIERSTFEFNILTNNGKKAFCNGELIKDSIVGSDSIIRTWKLNESIPSYLACVAVANYQTINQIHNGINGPVPILLAAEAADTNNLKNSFANLGNAISTYETNYGPYPWNKVGYSLVPFNAGAMEHVTNITYPRYAANGNLSEETLMAHELAHHWWGDLITCQTAEDMWINEGMASFSEYLFTESVYGKNAYVNAIKADLDEILHGAHIRENGYRAISGVPHQYTYGEHVYTKGALVAHTLRSYLGDSLFVTGLNSFLAENKFKDVNSYDFRNSLNNSTGKNTTDFFDNWVFNGGFPHFSIDSVTVSPNGNVFNTAVYIKQKLKGAPDFFSNVPLEILFMDASWNKHYETIIANGEFSIANLSLPFQPVYWELNPNQKISQAVSNNTMTISTTGNHNFNFGKMVLNVSAITDSAYLNIAHNWVAADPISYTTNNFKVSDYRYWSVEGILPDTFKASTKLYYDGRNALSGTGGFLDNTLFGTNEDSIVLLYRKNASENWSEFPYYTKNIQGSNTNLYGFMQVDDLLLGQYTFGYGDKTALAIADTKPVAEKLLIFPNPAASEFTLKIPGNDTKQATLLIYNFEGKQIAEKKLSGNTIKINTDRWSNGTYAIKVIGENGMELNEKIIIKR